MKLKNKIDFAIVIAAENCNPNGDPTMLNQPRHDIDGYGEMSSGCIKRKIRDRLQEQGQSIFVQAADRIDDGFKSMKQRADHCEELQKEIKKKKNADIELCKKIACKTWYDVRAFGQIFAFRGNEIAIGIRGPVSIGFAKTLEPIMICEKRIARSTNTQDELGFDSQRLGLRYNIDRGAYVAYGSIFPRLAEKTGFSQEDAESLKNAIKILFDNDASDFRPSGSMTSFLFWCKHNTPCGVMPSARVFHSLNIVPCEKWPFFLAEPDEISGITIERY